VFLCEGGFYVPWVHFKLKRLCLELFCYLLGQKWAFVRLSRHLPTLSMRFYLFTSFLLLTSSQLLRLHPKLALPFNNLGGRLVQLQLHKLVNYGTANWMNCCTSYSRREREGRQVSWRPSYGSLVSQKAAEELTQLGHYFPIRNKLKKHSSWTAECWETVTQYLFSCIHVTYFAHLHTVCSLASQTLSASGGSGSRDYSTFSHAQASPPDYHKHLNYSTKKNYISPWRLNTNCIKYCPF